jgi:hypothetical protein
MPRKRKRQIPNPSEILDLLFRAAKVTWAEIDRLIEIDALERRIRALRAGEAPVRHSGSRNDGRRKKRPKRTISVKGRASYQLQGRYIAHIRRFPKTARVKYQKIAKEHGREKAIAEMKRALLT